MRQNRFHGKVAVVTGGSNGLGRATVEGLADEGASVLICDQVDTGYFADRPEIATVVADVAAAGTADVVMDAALSRWGRVDILVNDAAAYPDGTLLEMSGPDWARVFAVNVTGAFLLTQAYARHRVEHGEGGSVVCISTGSVRSPRPGGAAYAASKAAIETMSKVFAMELGPYGIRVNIVSPGYIDVRQWSSAFPDRAPDELRDRLVQAIPLGRAGDPRDIASAVLFLCSDEASHVNGAVLEVDGGSNAGRFGLRTQVARAGSNVRG